MLPLVRGFALAGALALAATRVAGAGPTPPHLPGRVSQSRLGISIPKRDKETLAVRAGPFHPACPSTRAPSANPLAAIGATVRGAAPHIFSRPGEHPYRIEGLSSLTSPYVDPGIRRPAVRACGSVVANRSWAVYIAFPHWVKENRSAALSQALLYVADTPAGWRVWYRTE